MEAIIIDDERLARKELATLLSKHKEIKVIAEAANADEAKQLIEDKKPDVIFLDIQMPEKTGFELLQTLEYIPQVIFTTAYDEFALKAFEYNALDYLLKPVQEDRLAESIEKVSKRISNSSKEEGNSKKLTPDDQVFVKDGDKCWFVKLSEVRLFESDGNYIKVYFENHKPMIHKSLNALEERLDGRSFFRVSRKYVVNLSWVDKIDTWFNGGLMVQLKGGEKIEVSRRQSAKFKEMMSL